MVAFDGRVAGHVALALRRYRQELARHGFPRPDGLVELEELAESVAKAGASGQDRKSPDTVLPTDPVPGYGGGDGLLVTQAAAAEALGVSERTIRRWIDAGHLPSVGPSRRVPREAIERRGLLDPGREDRETASRGPR